MIKWIRRRFSPARWRSGDGQRRQFEQQQLDTAKKQLDTATRGVRWQRVGVLVSVIAVFVAVASVAVMLTTSPSEEQTDQPPMTSASSGPEVLPEPATRLFKVQGASSAYWVTDIPVRDLEAPPAYAELMGHCDEWEDYLAGIGAHAVRSSQHLGVDLGVQGELAVVAVRPILVSAKLVSSDELTLIQCTYGAGGEPGTVVTVDLTDPAGAVEVSLAEGGTGQMPPAAVVVNDPVYEGLTIEAVGTPGTLYEYYLELDVIVDGTTNTLTLGSRQAPLRWYSGDVAHLGSAIDWDVDLGEWVVGPPSDPSG